MRASLGLTRENRVVVLKGYFDESGTHGKKSALVCVAGYVFKNTEAIRFCRLWSDSVKPLLPPGADVFHATDCVRGRNAFWSCPQETRDQIFDEMIAITRETMLLGVAVGIDPTTYRRSTTGKQRFLRGILGDACTMCATRCVESVSQWLAENDPDGRVSYVFERGSKHIGPLATVLSQVCANEPIRNQYRCHDFSSLPKIDAIPLQAADLLAWEFHYAHTTAFSQEDKGRPWRMTLSRLVKERPHRIEVLSGDDIGARGLVQAVQRLRAEP